MLQASWHSCLPLPEGALAGDDLDILHETSEKSQVVVVRTQSRDLLAGQACTALGQGCGWAAGHKWAHRRLGAGGQAGQTSLEH